jgi:hypothetical protein
MWYKKTLKTALPKSTSPALQHCNFTTNYHQVSAEARVKEKKTSTSIANHDPRMNRTKPKYRAMLGVVGYLKHPVWFLQLFVVYLVCSWWCLQLLGVFLECVLLPYDCVCFGLLALKTFWCVKELWLENLPLLCVPSYLFMSAQVA